MHNPASVLENETQKLFRDFEVQTDHLILARRPDQVIINKKKKKKKEKKKKKDNLPNCEFCSPSRSLNKTERNWKES